MKSGWRGELGCGTSTSVEWYELLYSELLITELLMCFVSVFTVPAEFCDYAYCGLVCLVGEFERRWSGVDEKDMAHGHLSGMSTPVS
jgi:hypothetical protein